MSKAPIFTIFSQHATIYEGTYEPLKHKKPLHSKIHDSSCVEAPLFHPLRRFTDVLLTFWAANTFKYCFS